LLLLGLTPQRHLKLARLSRTYSRHLLTLERTEPCATTSPNDGRVRRSVSKKTALRENFFVLAARSLHLFCEPIDPNMMLFMFDRQGPADVFLSKNASQKNREHSYDLFMCHRGNDKSTVRVWSNSRHPHVSVVEFAERNGTGLGGRQILFPYPALTVLWERTENTAQHGQTACEDKRPRCGDQGKKLSL